MPKLKPWFHVVTLREDLRRESTPGRIRIRGEPRPHSRR